ncbi:MAG: hypothetical protein HGA45_07250 [Chloroflexales bacterium]|nr:hypothetical protein [Chloroflexales bacterium]
MNVTQTLDHEALVERAEAVRFWLLGFSLSNRASGAIQRELGAIIADDPGTNGRPLAGLTVADFVSELHSPNGGAVGRVKSVGEAALKELRAAIPADTRIAAPVEAAAPAELADEAPWADYELPVEEPAPHRRGRPKGSGKAAQKSPQAAPAPAQELIEAPAMAVPEAAEPEAAEPEAVAPKRRGRPRRTVAPEPVATQPVAAEEPAPKRRPGRPRRDAASVASLAATNSTQPATTKAAQAVPVIAENKAAPKDADPALDQLIRLWPALHPHARRAVVLYAGDLLIEG